jgi:preprotein translocase subunit SecF
MNKLIACLLLLLVGCTVTKRLHQPGYYVDWKSNSLRSIQVHNQTPKKDDEAITSESTPRTKTNEQAIIATHVSELDTSVLTTQNNSLREKAALPAKQYVQTNAEKVVKKMTKPLKITTRQMRSTTNQYVGATRADLLVRIGLILLLVAVITIGIGLLFIVFWGDLAWIIGVILTLIGVGALIASILLLLFSLLIFLLFG